MGESPPADPSEDPDDAPTDYVSYTKVMETCENCGFERETPMWMRPANALLGQEGVMDDRNLQLHCMLKSLQSEVTFSRKRIIQLQEELQAKEAMVREMTQELQRAEVGAEEMAYLVQSLQYQVRSGRTVEPRPRTAGEPAPEPLFATNSEAYQALLLYLCPIVARMKKAKADTAALRQTTCDALNAFQEDLRQKGAELQKMAAQYAKASKRPVRIEPVPTMMAEKCTVPHLTRVSAANLQVAVNGVCAAIVRLMIAAGGAIQLPEMQSKDNPGEHLESIRLGLLEVQKTVEAAAVQLSQRKPGTANRPKSQKSSEPVKGPTKEPEDELTEAQLEEMEEEQEEMQNQLDACVDLFLQDRGDPEVRHNLMKAFSSAEVKGRRKAPEGATTADKACQCSWGGGKAAQSSTPMRPGTSAQSPFSKGNRLQSDYAQVPVARLFRENPFLKTVRTIEKVLESAPRGTPARQKLEALLEEARQLLEDPDPKSKGYRPAVPDDVRAVVQFTQWRLEKKLRLAKQQLVIEGVFDVLHTCVAEEAVGVPPWPPSPALPRPVASPRPASPQRSASPPPIVSEKGRSHEYVVLAIPCGPTPADSPSPPLTTRSPITPNVSGRANYWTPGVSRLKPLLEGAGIQPMAREDSGHGRRMGRAPTKADRRALTPNYSPDDGSAGLSVGGVSAAANQESPKSMVLGYRGVKLHPLALPTTVHR